ncbi:MAG: biotin/lipoate A/B protein ligase family protein [Anaerolineae bacterium]|mgnify:CR=1 FL=1|uniref:lipoate--protein ligase family protein n=1 Tax=Candidatus Amarolinea dominans TaxID=3140696 RepID=UPI001DC66C1A|nr:lipoate--protein ligase family protein [Anaerolineae bacterium]MBK9096412.1 lipoate--protein ligase family protein [Anaerolineae bacterium]
MTDRWRLLSSAPLDGATNMALDEALAESAGAGESLPTLRFYQWAPPCLSLGRNQPLSEVDLAACQRLGYDIVRRPTGGRSILHTDELTYSVTGPASEPRLTGGVLDAYLRLAEALELGLERMGLTVKKAPGDTRTGADVSAACFEVPSAYEITVNGRKLIGSAQSRRQGWVLQHGSLPLTGDITRVVDGLAVASADEREALRLTLGQRATTVEAELGKPIDIHAAMVALAGAFAEHLHLSFEPGELSAREQQRVERLLSERYRHPAWTGKN